MSALTIKELTDFTLKSYTNLMRYLSQIYKIVPFCQIPREEVPFLVLRHDIDVSLLAALKMAEMETDLGIKSTYFVLFSSNFYNVLEGKNVEILRQISKLGHEVGLHYDPSQYRSYNRNPKKTLKIEIQLLEHLLNRGVYSIARHGPWDKDPFATTKEYINANHPSMRRDVFVHDSSRAWTPLQDLFKLLNNPPRRVQLLTHPENWQEDKLSREALLDRFFQNLHKEMLTLKECEKRAWLTDPLVLEYDALVRKKDFMKSSSGRSKSDSTLKSKFRQELDYYDTLFRWYMINTSLGWQGHQILDKIRSILEYKRK